MYLTLSPKTGQLWLDSKKFLMRKKQMGLKESSPLFNVLGRLVISSMFETFTRGRIHDVEVPPRVVLYHIPLFALCEMHMRKTKTSFRSVNIRRIVFTTMSSAPKHLTTERMEKTRKLAFDLTSDIPSDVDRNVELKNLITETKDSNTSLCQVMAVIWKRIGEAKSSNWKESLLGLHLLKNLLLHGDNSSIFTGISGYPIAMMIIITLGKFGITGVFAIIYLHAAELFPTVLRSTGKDSMISGPNKGIHLLLSLTL